MAHGRHRKRRTTRRVLTALAVGMLLLGVSACEGAAVGQVTNRIYHESGTRYMLEVQQADGQRVRIRVTKQAYDRCWTGERYPDCSRPAKSPNLRKVSWNSH